MATKRKTTQQKLDEVLDIANEEIKESGKEVIVITPKDIQKELQTNEIINPHEPDSEQDFKKARNGLHRLLEKAERAVDGILDVAEEGGEARHYEVTGQLIRITADIYKDLLSLQKTRLEVNKFKLLNGESQEIPNSIVPESHGDTYIFQGTTTDMADEIRRQRKIKQQDK